MTPVPGLGPSTATAAWSDRPLDHVAIALASLADGAAYAALGWRPDGPDEVVADQGVTVRLLRGGAVPAGAVPAGAVPAGAVPAGAVPAGAVPALELLAPLAPDTPVGRFLARRGPGLHHVAFRVTDLEAEIDRLAALGAVFVPPSPRAGRAGSRVAFLHPRWTGGVLVELVCHP